MLIPNDKKGWYGCFSEIGRRAASQNLLLSKDSLSSAITKTFEQNKEPKNKNLEIFKKNNEINLDIFSIDEFDNINLDEIIKNPILKANNKAKTSKLNLFNQNSNSKKYYYNHLQRKKKEKILDKGVPPCTKYNPRYTSIFKRSASSPSWSRTKGRGELFEQKVDQHPFYIEHKSILKTMAGKAFINMRKQKKFKLKKKYNSNDKNIFTLKKNMSAIITPINKMRKNDLSIINIPESDPTYQKVISKSIDYVDGKEVIREGSPLADFITYWTGRYSMPGIYDANIASACEENRTGKIPILSSIASMFSSSTSEYCKSVADGSRYINSDSNPNWETEKYHQLYVLNNRVKENLGFYKNKTNPLTAFRENYDAKHPLDNSRSGYLARISGLTKYDAETVIALSDYYQKLADYKPENSYQFTPAHDPVSNLRGDSFSDKLPSSSTAISSISLSDSGTMLARPEETTA